MYYLASLQNFLKSAKGLRGFVLGADGWRMGKMGRWAEADGKNRMDMTLGKRRSKPVLASAPHSFSFNACPNAEDFVILLLVNP